jgi:hypothetical protein
MRSLQLHLSFFIDETTHYRKLADKLNKLNKDEVNSLPFQRTY